MTVKFTSDGKAPDGTLLIVGIRYDQAAGAGGPRSLESARSARPPLIYTYAMLKASGLWYVTGGSGKVPTAAGWGAIQRWLDRDGRIVEWVKIVTETADVYPVKPVPFTVHHLDGTSTTSPVDAPRVTG
jgi:hypothetical protein